MEYDLKTYLPNDVLTKVDRMSMRASLESREPLLDHRLVEFAATIPTHLKIRNGTGKHILKRIMSPYLPAEVLHKQKQGFSVPLSTWLRTDLRNDILDTLRGKGLVFGERGGPVSSVIPPTEAAPAVEEAEAPPPVQPPRVGGASAAEAVPPGPIGLLPGRCTIHGRFCSGSAPGRTGYALEPASTEVCSKGCSESAEY